MHCNSQLFYHFSPIESRQNDQICLVLTEFPQTTNLGLIKTIIEEEFTFVNKVNVRNDSEIQCYFDSMTDLIQLDQGRRFGATKAFIREISEQATICDPEDEIQKLHGVFSNSSQTFESQTVVILPSYKYIPSVKEVIGITETIDPRLLHHPRQQRLTSLQDQIEQLQHLRSELGLFKDEIDWEKTGVTDYVQEESEEECTGNQADLNIGNINQRKDRLLRGEIMDHQDEKRDNAGKIKPTGKEMMISLIQGAALTGILLGGLKLLKTFIG